MEMTLHWANKESEPTINDLIYDNISVEVFLSKEPLVQVI